MLPKQVYYHYTTPRITEVHPILKYGKKKEGVVTETLDLFNQIRYDLFSCGHSLMVGQVVAND